MPPPESKSAESRSAAEILAWSEARLARIPEGRPAICLWRPKELTVAIGVSQSSERDIVPETVKRDGAALVRRASGGGSVVLCEGVLCWEAWADVADVKRINADGSGDGGIRAAYATLSLPVVNALRALGVEAVQAGICDIAVGGGENGEGAHRKVAGTAQLRRRNKALVHGSLLVNADRTLLPRYLPQPEVAPEYRAGRGHDVFCANISTLVPGEPDIMGAVAARIREAAAALGWNVTTPPDELPEDAKKLLREKYLSPDWNWKKVRPL